MLDKLNVFYNLLLVENERIFVMCSVPISYIATFFYLKLICEILDIKGSKMQKAVFILVNGSFMIAGRVLMIAPYYRLYNMVVMPVLIYVVFKVNILKAVLSDVLIFLIIVTTDSIFSMPYCHMFGVVNFKAGLDIPIYKLTLLLTIMLVTVTVYTVIKKLNVKIKIAEVQNTRLNVVTVSTIGLVIMAIQLWETIFIGDNIPMILIIGNSLATVVYFYLSMSNINKTYEINNANMCIETLESYNTTLKVLNDDMRAFKHDFNNIMQTINGYVIADDIVGLKKYYGAMLKDCIEINSLEMMNPNTFNNPAIYSIVNNKVHIARKLGIGITVTVFADLNKINENIYEVSRVLGILLDNAIEAARECQNKIIEVEFSMDKPKGVQTIKICNTYHDENIDMEKIFEKDYSTKPGNTGLGLWEVRQIVSRNDDMALITDKDYKYFKQTIELQLNESLCNKC